MPGLFALYRLGYHYLLSATQTGIPFFVAKPQGNLTPARGSMDVGHEIDSTTGFLLLTRQNVVRGTRISFPENITIQPPACRLPATRILNGSIIRQFLWPTDRVDPTDLQDVSGAGDCQPNPNSHPQM